MVGDLEEFVPGILWLKAYPVHHAGLDFAARRTVVRPPRGGLLLHSPSGWAEGRLRAQAADLANLKAESDIHQLHKEIDHQLAHQWNKLAGLRQVQINLPGETANGRR